MTKVTRLTLDQSGGLERRRLHLREICDDADAPLETVGLDLRAARQRKGEDLATVSQALKIRKDHLEALEESNFEALPGRTYAIGFVRSYSEYLGLDPVRCVERFKAEIAGREPEDVFLPAMAPIPDRKLPQGTIVLVTLLVVAVAYGGYYLSVSADRMLSQDVAPVPERLASALPAASGTHAPAGSTAAVTPVTAANAGNMVAPVQNPPTAAEPAPDATPPTAGSGASQQTAALPPGRAFGTRNVNSRITLRIHDSARVLVQGADNTIFLNRTLRPGDLYQAPNIVGMTLTTANAGAVEIILDGTSLGFVGADGMVADGLSLNPQDLVDQLGQNRAG